MTLHPSMTIVGQLQAHHNPSPAAHGEPKVPTIRRSAEIRGQVLDALKEGPASVTEIAWDLDVSEATVYSHIGKLIDAETVRRINGRPVRYEVVND